MAKISGVFAATGQSSQFASGSFLVIMSFAGTATVSVEAYDPDNANWVVIESKTASGVFKYDGYGDTQCRLNCSAHTNDVDYCVFT